MIERKTAKLSGERIAGLLRKLIISGEIPLGSPVRQQKLASRFGVSTTPVREALQLLVAEGLVKIDPHRGAIVRRPSSDEIRETFDMRIALEGLAVERAVPKIMQATVNDLHVLVGQMERAKDVEKWAELNQQFHVRMYQAARLPRLSWTIDRLRDSSHVYFNMVTRPFWRDESNLAHRRILAAIEAKDVRGARKAIEKHLQEVLDSILEVVEAEEKNTSSEDASGETLQA